MMKRNGVTIWDVLCIVITFVILVCFGFVTYVTVSEAKYDLTEEQVRVADEIAKVATEEYDTYHVLPSLAVTQACQESSLGVRCRGNNLWGIKSGAESYDTIREGTLRYLEVINNGYYDKAVNNKNFKDAITEIIKGGYCEGNPKYVEECIWLYNTYNFSVYDEEILKGVNKVTVESERKKSFNVVYDPSVPSYAVKINPKYIKTGCITITYMKALSGIFDVIPDDTVDDRTIVLSNYRLQKSKVKINFLPEAKG